MTMFKWFSAIFNNQKESITYDPMKYLIVGLGNIGSEYENTRHNIGFDVVDKMAADDNAKWEVDTLAFSCEIKHKGRTLILIKPTTYMNLSGKAVNHHMSKHKIPKENILVILDDLNIDFGMLRLRDKGSDGGHNGLKHIDSTLGGNDYPRLRVGIGSKFHKGQQVNFVLGKWKPIEKEDVAFIIDKAAEAAKSFTAIGVKHTTNLYNGDLLKKP